MYLFIPPEIASTYIIVEFAGKDKYLLMALVLIGQLAFLSLERMALNPGLVPLSCPVLRRWAFAWRSLGVLLASWQGVHCRPAGPMLIGPAAMSSCQRLWRRRMSRSGGAVQFRLSASVPASCDQVACARMDRAVVRWK